MQKEQELIRIDSHHHLWELSQVHYPWLSEKGIKRFFGDPSQIQRDFTFEEYSQLAKESFFNGSVHIQVGAEDGYAEAKWVQEVSEKNLEWPLVQVAFCDISSKDAQKQLTSLKKLSTVVGIRQILGRSQKEDLLTSTNSLIQNPRFKEGLKIVEEMGFSFDLQITPNLFEQISELFSEFPHLKKILCHAGSPMNNKGLELEFWKNGIQQFSSLPNTYCKISGLPMFFKTIEKATVNPIIQHCLQTFGPSRCMFGSNFPVDSLYISYKELVTVYQHCIAEEDCPAVFGLTAKEVYF